MSDFSMGAGLSSRTFVFLKLSAMDAAVAAAEEVAAAQKAEAELSAERAAYDAKEKAAQDARARQAESEMKPELVRFQQ